MNFNSQPRQFSSQIFKEVLDDFYHRYIENELMCYRSFIEDTHFLYSTFMLELLLNEYDKARENSISPKLLLDEITNFVIYLIENRSRYMGQYLQQELFTLQKNRSSFEYLKKMAISYKYWVIMCSERVNVKISQINENFSRAYTFLNDLFLKLKIKLTNDFKIAPELSRFGIFSESFQTIKPQPNQNIRQRKTRDNMILENQIKGQLQWMDTLMNEEQIKILSQIEKVQKGPFEIIINIEDQRCTETNELIQYARNPIQAAEQFKFQVGKQNRQLDERKRRAEENDEGMHDEQALNGESNKGNYWEFVQYKLSHDKQLLESMIGEYYTLEKCSLPTLIQVNLNDQAEQICCIEIGKFGNVMACGCFDGCIFIYELTENFLLPGLNKQESNPKQKSKITFQVSFEIQQHEGPITALSLLYDEFNLISASTDQTIKLWCLRTRQPLVVYKGHLSTIWCLSWAPAGYWFASGSADKTAMLWATDRIHCQRVFDPTAAVTIVGFTPSVQQVITGDELRTIRAWDIESGECLTLIILKDDPICMSISQSGLYCVIGCRDGQVNLFFLPQMKLIKSDIYMDRADSNKLNKRDVIGGVSISFDETLICCNTKNKIAFYSIGNLSKPQNEDVFLGQSLAQEIECMSKKYPNIIKSTQAVEILDNQAQENNLFIQMIPQGYCLVIVR